MNKMFKPEYRQLMLCIIALIISTEMMARDYVPPPNGPYQSSASVVINQKVEGHSDQVEIYRFPPEDLDSQEPPPMDDLYAPGKPAQVDTPMVTNRAPAVNDPFALNRENTSQWPQHQEIDSIQTPAMPSINAPVYSNPWAIDGQHFQYPPPNTYQYPRQDYYRPQYQYPMMPNQSYPMNMPFQGMPSPWKDMPMNPFSSGR